MTIGTIGKPLAREKQQLWAILTIVFLGFIGLSISYLIFPSLFLNQASPLLPQNCSDPTRALYLGLAFAAYPLGTFFGSPLLGALADAYDRKHLLTISLIVTGCTDLLIGVAIAKQHLGMFLASLVASGIIGGSIVTLARAMVTNFKTLPKHATFGKITAVKSIAYVIGPVIGGLMTSNRFFSLRALFVPFFFTSTLFFILALVSVVMVRKSGRHACDPEHTVRERLNFLKRAKTLLRNKHLKFLMLASTSFAIAVDMFYEFGPVYLTVKWSLIPAQLIIYNTSLCIGLAIGTGLLPPFFAKRSSRLSIVGTTWGFALIVVLIAFTNSSLLMPVLFGAGGVVIGLAETFLIVKISDCVPEAIQGEIIGMQQSMIILGDCFSSLLGGVLLILSSKIILLFAAVLSIATMLYYRRDLKSL